MSRDLETSTVAWKRGEEEVQRRSKELEAKNKKTGNPLLETLAPKSLCFVSSWLIVSRF